MCEMLAGTQLRRKDTGAGFHDFVAWAQSYLAGSGDVFTVSRQYNACGVGAEQTSDSWYNASHM